jgi:hypothetical protein
VVQELVVIDKPTVWDLFAELNDKGEIMGQPIEDKAAQAAKTEVPAGESLPGDEMIGDSQPLFTRADDPEHGVGWKRASTPAVPAFHVQALLSGQHAFIEAQRAFVYNQKLDELAAAQDQYIIVLSEALKSLRVF